jgi:hypothetical protein
MSQPASRKSDAEEAALGYLQLPGYAAESRLQSRCRVFMHLNGDPIAESRPPKSAGGSRR